MDTKTSQSDKDLQKRKEDFVKELGELQKKHDLALASAAFLTPDGRIASRVELVDGELIRKQQEKNSELSK